MYTHLSATLPYASLVVDIVHPCQAVYDWCNSPKITQTWCKCLCAVIETVKKNCMLTQCTHTCAHFDTSTSTLFLSDNYCQESASHSDIQISLWFQFLHANKCYFILDFESGYFHATQFVFSHLICSSYWRSVESHGLNFSFSNCWWREHVNWTSCLVLCSTSARWCFAAAID